MRKCNGSYRELYADFRRQQAIDTARQVEEMEAARNQLDQELELLKDELFDSKFVDLVERIEIAAKDDDRPPVAMKRLNEIWTELSLLVNEAAEYQV